MNTWLTAKKKWSGSLKNMPIEWLYSSLKLKQRMFHKGKDCCSSTSISFHYCHVYDMRTVASIVESHRNSELMSFGEFYAEFSNNRVGIVRKFINNLWYFSGDFSELGKV